MLKSFILSKLPTFDETWLLSSSSSSSKEHIFGNGWINGHVCKSFTSQLIYAVAEGDNQFDIEAKRLHSFYPKLDDLANSQIFASKLANQGFYFTNGYVECYGCQRRIHFDNVLLGRKPDHCDNCRAAQRPPAETAYKQFWEKQS